MDSIPAWVMRLVHRMQEIAELQSLGTVDWQWCDSEDQLLLAPGTQAQSR